MIVENDCNTWDLENIRLMFLLKAKDTYKGIDNDVIKMYFFMINYTSLNCEA